MDPTKSCPSGIRIAQGSTLISAVGRNFNTSLTTIVRKREYNTGNAITTTVTKWDLLLSNAIKMYYLHCKLNRKKSKLNKTLFVFYLYLVRSVKVKLYLNKPSSTTLKRCLKLVVVEIQ